MSKWMARLSFSFIIIAAVLAWEGYKRGSNAHYVAAAIFAGLGAIGVRERHRPG